MEKKLTAFQSAVLAVLGIAMKNEVPAVPEAKAPKAKATSKTKKHIVKQEPATLAQLTSLVGKRVQFEHSHIVRGGELRLVTGSWATGEFVIGEGKPYAMLKNPVNPDDAGKTFGLFWPNGQGKVYKLRQLDA